MTWHKLSTVDLLLLPPLFWCHHVALHNAELYCNVHKTYRRLSVGKGALLQQSDKNTGESAIALLCQILLLTLAL